MVMSQFLISKLKEEYGCFFDRILAGFESKRVTTFRVNTVKATNEEVLSFLDERGIEYESVPWYDSAFIVRSNVDLRKLDIYDKGMIYIQSLSSMLPPIVLEPGCEKILDMTAAPGGKTTEIYNLSGGLALITAVEKNRIRADRLKYNLEKQGASATVIVGDATKLDEFFSFDKILLDAPCSGSGTLSDVNSFNDYLLDSSVKVQECLLNKALSVLKKGHIMVYSTCSILKEENEFQLDKLIKAGRIEIVEIDTDIFKDVLCLPTLIKGTVCVCPSALYEGFFIAKIRKIC